MAPNRKNANKAVKETVNKDINNVVKNIDFLSLQNKKVLITGASGLVGFYLAQCIKKLQNEQ